MAWSLIHARLHTLLRKRNLLPKHTPILIAVSGGQDSLCLAQLLIDLIPQWNWSLAIVHCDHRWREDSADNAAHVLKLGQEWNLPTWIETADHPARTEASARAWRYDIVADLARTEGYTAVVTGHTLSDRAETVLYNLIRGTGLDGIATLPWQRPIDEQKPVIQLVRPLLDFCREDTGQFCQQRQLPIWEDGTNQDVAFRRNRVRQELLPYLQAHFNPKVEQALAQLCEITAADTHYLNEQTSQLYRKAITTSKASDGTPRWCIQRQPLNAAPLALQRRVIRQLLQQALPKPPNFEQIEKIIFLLQAPNGSRSDTYPGGLIAEVHRKSINQKSDLIYLGAPEANT